MDPKTIIFEDDSIIAINKPQGLVVNKSDTSKDKTLQEILYEYLVLPSEDTEFFSRAGIVHRLDKDTSGVVLVAKTAAVFENLKEQFKRREVDKHYYAVVVGNIEDSKLEIKAPIGRNPQNRMRFAIVEGGKEAVTKAVKIADKEGYTSMDITLLTGRTHQIRVHLAALGHPVAGDLLYCSRSVYESSIKYFKRMMLHSYSLTFKHPTSGKTLTIDCPPKEKIWQIFIPQI